MEGWLLVASVAGHSKAWWQIVSPPSSDDLTHDRGQVSAGTLTGDAKSRGVATPGVCVFAKPADGVNAVAGGLRRVMLRRPLVVDADHDRLDGPGQERAQRVVASGAAQHPSAAVEVHEHAKRLH
jgi:hypothetical protein